MQPGTKNKYVISDTRWPAAKVDVNACANAESLCLQAFHACSKK
jgi:hypothetical protein